MDSIAAGELPQADGISWKYKNSIEFPKTDHELSGHGSHMTSIFSKFDCPTDPGAPSLWFCYFAIKADRDAG